MSPSTFLLACDKFLNSLDVVFNDDVCSSVLSVLPLVFLSYRYTFLHSHMAFLYVNIFVLLFDHSHCFVLSYSSSFDTTFGYSLHKIYLHIICWWSALILLTVSLVNDRSLVLCRNIFSSISWKFVALCWMIFGSCWICSWIFLQHWSKKVCGEVAHLNIDVRTKYLNVYHSYVFHRFCIWSLFLGFFGDVITRYCVWFG